MMQKVLVTGILGLLLVGCAADTGWKVAYEQERTTRQEQDSRIRNLEAQQRQQQTQQQTQPQTPTPQQPPAVQQPPAQRKATIAEVVYKCEKLQSERTIPIGCWTGDTDKKLPYLIFKFANHDALNLYWDKLIEYFVVDFCGRYTEVGRDAIVSAVLVDANVFRVMDCANGNVSNWEKFDEKKSVNRY